jgi:hypothetical protein
MPKRNIHFANDPGGHRVISLAAIGTILAYLFLALGIGNIAYLLHSLTIPLNEEAALVDVRSIAVDEQGHILLLSNAYHRIQLFDQQGNFQRSISLPTNSGRNAYQLCNTGSTVLVTVFVFEQYQSALQLASDTFVPWAAAVPPVCMEWGSHQLTTVQNATYEIKDWPRRVVRRGPGNGETSVIRGRWLTTLTHPKFGVGYAVVGCGLMLLALYVKNARR